MLHIVLALNIIAFSFGFTAFAISLIARARYKSLTFRDLALLLLAILLLLVVDMVKLYDTIANAGLTVLSPYAYAVVSAAGLGLLACMIPQLSTRIIFDEVTRPARALFLSIGLVAAILGGLSEALPSGGIFVVSTLWIIGVQGYGITIILTNLRRLTSPRLRILMRNSTLLIVVGMAAGFAELAVRSLLRGQLHKLDFSVTKIFYLLAGGILFLIYAFSDLFKNENNPTIMIPEPFIQSFGISPRERQIVSMMIQGYSNRRIGEELFISSITVKNHIYHIYQKTGVENKVQLINLLNQPK